MAGTQIAKSAIWTWFNTPGCVVAGGSLIFGAHCGPRARPTIYRVDLTGNDEVSSAYIHPGAGSTEQEVDDHNDPSVLRLRNGNLLARWGRHDTTNQFVAVTTGGIDISTFSEPTNISSVAQDTYSQLFQAADTAGTVFDFFRRLKTGSTRPQYYRTSTDAAPTTFTSPVEWLTETDERPYPRYCKSDTNASRCHFAINNGGPGEANLSLYHGYMDVSSAGVPTWYKSDGTLVGGVANLPFAPSAFTLVRDGTTDDWWVNDLQVYSDLPVIISQRAPARDWTDQYYWRSKWSGSAWSSEAAVDAAEVGVSTSIEPSASEPYTGLCCLDPNNSDIVYASRGYTNDSNFRLEQWTRSAGVWSKTIDVSGDTSNKNCRPRAFNHNGVTKVIWWSGTYSTYTSFATDVYLYPQISLRSAKVTTPTLEARFAPIGSKILLPLQEGTGTPVDLRGTYTVTTTGSLTWTSTAFGYHLSGFDTSNYLKFDSLAATLIAASTPRWMAVLYSNTSTSTALVPFSFGGASDTPYMYLAVNQGSAGNVSFNLRNDASTAITVSGAAASCNDGEKHVLMGASGSNTAHNCYFDGASVAASSTALGTTTLTLASVGLLRRSTLNSAFPGNIYAVAAGYGAMPNPADLYLDWINGRFSGMGSAIVTANSGSGGGFTGGFAT